MIPTFGGNDNKEVPLIFQFDDHDPHQDFDDLDYTYKSHIFLLFLSQGHHK